ncbi:MAG: hypothetical protein UY50_C0003G0024 [Parcubacteria group bacterium GW2011_GWA2_49_9]|nr:MAG: hypothetical protein UY50_C0003G0024 [Parcubacteria group bacterium GW2011_GWA2_49_9]
MKKVLILGLLLLVIPFVTSGLGEYNPQSAGAGNPELHIKPDGSITIKSARIEQIAGTTFYIVAKWGSLPFSFTMKTDERTSVTKRYGGSAAVTAMKQGDYIDVEGQFFVGSDFFGVDAIKIKDWLLQEESGTFAGVITEVNANQTFTLRTTARQLITVKLSASADIKKGVITIPFERLRKGDAVPFISGVYDYSRNTLTADTVNIYQTKTDFLPRNFEGTLKQIVSGTIPATLIVTVAGSDYTVKISDKTLIMKKNRTSAQLARFVVKDTVRFYGGVREEEKTLSDSLIVDAEVVRNLNL